MPLFARYQGDKLGDLVKLHRRIMEKNTSIVIVNWNSGEQLLRCIQSIAESGLESTSRVVIVDNGSNDDSESAAEGFPFVSLIRTGENLGFAKACNLGANRCDSKYLLFLNPDARLYLGSLERVVAFMQKPENFQVGICGVQLLDENGDIARTCARFPTFFRLLSHSIGLSRFFSKTGYFMTDWAHDDSRDVDHVIGAFYLVRRQLFEEIGGFDERFFVYLEDLDFSYRAHKAGWKTFYLAEAQAFHAGGGTSRQVKAKRLFYSLRSRIFYAFKHFSKWQVWTLLLLTCLVEPFTRTVFCLFKRDWSGVKNTFSGYQMLYAALPNIITHKDKSV